jgi:hypothetical protein
MVDQDQPNPWKPEPDDGDLQRITPDMDEEERQHYLWSAIGYFFNIKPRLDVATAFAKLMEFNSQNNPPFKKYEIRDKNRWAWKNWLPK